MSSCKVSVIMSDFHQHRRVSTDFIKSFKYETQWKSSGGTRSIAWGRTNMSSLTDAFCKLLCEGAKKINKREVFSTVYMPARS